MEKSTRRARMIMTLASIVFIAAALFMLLGSFETDRQYEYIIAGTCLAVSLIYFLNFGMNRRLYFRPGWLIQNAFFLLFFGVIILFLPMIDFELNSTVYGFLALFMACTQFAASIQLCALEIRRWWWVLIFGCINTLFGVYFIKLCLVMNLSEYKSVATYMIVLGVISLFESYVYNASNSKKSIAQN